MSAISAGLTLLKEKRTHFVDNDQYSDNANILNDQERTSNVFNAYYNSIETEVGR